MTRTRQFEPSDVLNVTSTATTPVLDVGGATTISSQVEIGVSGVITGGPGNAGATIVPQKSNDKENWTDVEAVTSVLATGTVWYEIEAPAYRWFRMEFVTKSGGLDVTAKSLVMYDD